MSILVISLVRLIYSGNSLGTFEIIYLIFFIFLSAFFNSSLTIMLCLQIFLISIGMTTNEYLKGTYTNIPNPFHQGCCKNFYEFLFGDVSSKNLDLGYFKKKDEVSSKRTESLASITTNLN